MFSWLTTALQTDAQAAETKAPFPAPLLDATAEKQQKTAKAVFAGGCFWCTEAVCERVRGVKNVVSGYAGGSADTADYRKVSAGMTDHAEVIEVTYDPNVISYGKLLQIFFAVAHDPTQLNRQGPDYGKQYRSAIFYANDEQKKVAEAYIAQLNAAGIFSKKIVTTLEKLEKFYPAESYHQDYVRNNPSQGYVVGNALPKVEKLKKAYPELLADPQKK
ncbi:MAG: peptide-methionine (S)-S-oxide reductase MsrA [Bryobacterales bacterium]|nr:peptide-methionine (S)-S-oxide reductase MsrA [Bryobacterales bacterium]